MAASMDRPAVAAEEGAAGGKGLKGNALGFMSGLVIGVASTAPGYSLAASLGLVAAAVGLQAPAIMILAFVPMLFIASAYYYLNRADPDCGTHGESPLVGALLGSVPYKLLHRSTIPVVVVPPRG